MGEKTDIIQEIMGMDEGAAVSLVSGLNVEEFEKLLANTDRLSAPIVKALWEVAEARAEG